jgi:putative transposase
LDLKAKHTLSRLLNTCGLAKSVFYYQCKVLIKPNPNEKEKSAIREVFYRHKERYGYRRITLALRKLGMIINHKKVQRLMSELNLKSNVRPKRYNSYKGPEGKSVKNLLQRDFEVNKPNQKWVTDVTEFKVKGQKVYLSPVIDLCSADVVAYRTAKSAHLPMVQEMFEEAISKLSDGDQPILHSDQGWQHRLPRIQKILKDAGLKQSMSRKGNCLDNAAAESFFAVLKTEMFHGYDFESADELIIKIDEYIKYYNTERIKVKLKGLTPIEHRNQALLAA